ncbi:S-layer homology domain-containing protein [uncultured Veillonella sp.]|uniref:S-layer homology domain-containing protein n=1 Tax=uncultured Veillonella sp. TaxID=159268 RepID=UPI0028038D33|nr:S-layer homology domain-containing protein [uncultured Veillonella sp.]
MYKNTPYALRALVLGTLLATTGLGFVSANTTTQAATTTAASTKVEAPSVTSTQAVTINTAAPNVATTKAEAHKFDAAKAATPVVVNTSIGTPQDIQKIRAHIFSDVPSDFWAANSISTVTKANLMKGYSDGTFRPNQPMTREEVAALFNNITDDGTAAFLSSKFKDITSDRWSALAIESVARKNIISGYGDNTYKPEKYMSRQEFAVVADNYIHYLGYTTEDPTALDNIAYGDQKFVAPWAQDAVRELAYLGFTNYAPGTLFNPEKYVTRAEAAEIAYRMTQTEQALAFHNTLFKQQVENKTATIIDKTLGYGNDFTKFRQDGALFWDGGKLHATLTDKKKAEAVAHALSEAQDPQLESALVVSQGKLNQAQLEDYQSDAIDLYKAKEPKGNIISIRPNDDTSALIITADSVQKDTVKAFKKKFKNNVVVQLPQPETVKPDAAIQFPLPPRVNYYDTTNK